MATRKIYLNDPYIILILIFIVFVISQMAWLKIHDLYFCFDGYHHYCCSVNHMNFLKNGLFTRFFLPPDGDHPLYPNLIYQFTGIVFLFLGKSPECSVLSNFAFILLLIISVYLIGRELWNPETGILAALVSVSIPLVQDVTRRNLLDMQLAAVVALCCYLIIKSKHFTVSFYTKAFFTALAFASLIKWTAFFYISGLFIISLWIMLSKLDKKEKVQFFKSGAGLFVSLLIPLAVRYYYFSMNKDGFDLYSYLTGIALLVAFYIYLRKNQKIHTQIKEFYSGFSLFFLFCAHFYYLKFWNLVRFYPQVASRGSSRNQDSLAVSWSYFNSFLSNNWLIFLIAGLLCYLFMKNKKKEINYFIASIPIGMLFFFYHPDRDYRYALPLIVFFAPLMTFWICRISNKALKIGALLLLLSQVALSLAGWTIPENTVFYSFIRSTYTKMRVGEFTGKRPVALSSDEKKDFDFLTDEIAKAAGEEPSILIFGKPSKTYFGYRNEDIVFELFENKGCFLDIVTISGGINNHFSPITYSGYYYYYLYYIYNYSSLQKHMAMDKAKIDRLKIIMAGGNNRLYLFGENRFFTILDGDNLKPSSKTVSPPPSEVISAWISPAESIYALLDNGKIYVYSDNKWKFHSAVSPLNRKIFGYSDEEIYAAGFLGTVSRYDGTGWTSFKRGTLRSINAVYRAGPDDIYIAGDNGTLLRCRSNRWEKLNAGTDEDIFCMAGAGNDVVYMGGTNGLILKLTDGGISRIDSSVDFDIESIWCKNPDDIYFTGDSNKMLHYKNGRIHEITLLNNNTYNWESITGNNRGIYLTGGDRMVLCFADNRVKNIITMKDESLKINRIICVKITPGGSPLTGKMGFHRIINKYYPALQENYTCKRMPGTGHYLEIFLYR